MTRIAIVVGNIRPNRMAASVAEWVLEMPPTDTEAQV